MSLAEFPIILYPEDFDEIEIKGKGTKEWSHATINLLDGCPNACGGDGEDYCWAKHLALQQKRLDLPSHWRNVKINENKMRNSYKKIKKLPPYVIIMFPSTHDIFLEHFPIFMPYMKEILKQGKRLLLVSKLRLEVAKEIIAQFKEWRHLVIIRVTIGTHHSEILHKYEEKAPSFEERLESLKLLHENGFFTSVSLEPYLSMDIEETIKILNPYTRGTIWIGLMNYCIPESLNDLYTYPSALKIYESVKRFSQIRFKDSIKKLLKIDRRGNPVIPLKGRGN